jgi:hypothetical protein
VKTPIEREPAGEPFSGKQQARRNVIAEIDYIRNAGKEDITALVAAFGTIHVPKRSYREAVDCAKAKGIVAEGVFTPADAESGGEIYECVALAHALGAVIITDSANIRRICQKRGIPCWSSSEWGLMAPAPG